MIKTYDTFANSGYLRFSRNPVKITKELSENILCDFDANGKLVGVEMVDCVPSDFEDLEFIGQSQENMAA